MRSLAGFFGRFNIAREIEDHRAQARSTFEGVAEIARTPKGAIYRETGYLVMGTQRFAAERVYLWRAAGARIDVLFEDGRAFHDFDPEHGGLASEHLCGADMYRGGYDVSAWPRWSVTWNVNGPRKDYRSVTQYTPLA